jgi:hypothetical protein
MRITERSSLKPVLIALSLMVSGAGAASGVLQSGTQQTIVVDSGRPLADAVETLQKRLGVVITYEDPPYLHASQLRDATSEVRRGAPNERRIVVPRGGTLSFSYQLPQGTPEAQAFSLLEGLLQQHRAKGYGGNFRIDKTDRVFHVVPTQRRSRSGKDETFQALLDTPVQIESTEQSAMDVVRRLVVALRGSTDIPVVLGSVPENLLAHTTVKPDSEMKPAREELVSVLASTGQALSWQLLFGNEPEIWVLNIYSAR